MGINNLRNLKQLSSQAYEEFYKEAQGYSQNNNGEKIPPAYQANRVNYWANELVSWRNSFKGRYLTDDPTRYFYNMASRAANEARLDVKRNMRKRDSRVAEFDKKQRAKQKLKSKVEYTSSTSGQNSQSHFLSFILKWLLLIILGVMGLFILVEYLVPLLVWLFFHIFIWIILALVALWLLAKTIH